MKTMTMKLQKDVIMCNYYSMALHWGFCTAPNSKGEFKLTTGFGYCREGLTAHVFGFVKRNTPRASTNSQVSFMRTRLAAKIMIRPDSNAGVIAKKTKEFHRWMESGVSVLNILEAKHGWPLTRMYKVEHVYGERIVVCMFVGSARWMRSPAMLSMFALLVRMSNHKVFSDIKDYEGFMEAVQKYIRGRHTDCDHARHTSPYWDIIMSNFIKLFNGFSAKENFTQENYGEYIESEGISKFCKGETNYGALGERFRNLVKAHGMKL